jgi:hypothetical protein
MADLPPHRGGRLGRRFIDLHVPDGESPERTAERALEALG